MTTSNPETTLEVAVYTVDDPARFVALRQAAQAEIARSEAGLLWWQTLCPLSPGLRQELPAEMHGDDASPQQLYADVVAWQSLAAARTAGERVASANEFAEFRGAITGMAHFAHYRALAPANQLHTTIANAPLVEIAAYDTSDPAVHAAAQELLYREKLPKQSGWRGGARLQHSSELNGAADLLGWQSIAAWQKTGAQMQSDPELAPFFNGLARTHVFSLFAHEARGS